MGVFKDFFSFSKGERVAVIAIVALIVLTIIAKYIIVRTPVKFNQYHYNLDSIIALGREMKEEKKEFRKKEAIVKEKPKPQKNKNLQERKFDKKLQVAKETTIPIIDLNVADTVELMKLPGIGSSFAKRIVEYKEKLGGYYSVSQLLEVYGMDSVRYNGISNYVTTDSVALRKLKVNYDTFKTLLRHPYLEYDDVKKIVNQRERKGLIVDWNQLRTILLREEEDCLQYYVEY